MNTRLMAITPDLDSLSLQHRDHLPRNLPSCQVALNAQLRRQAKLAVDCAADLARNADGRTAINLWRATDRLLIFIGDSAIPVRHPHCFDRLVRQKRR